MAKEILHYNIDTLDKLGANINWILGERSNGKSYQVKHKKGIYPWLYDSPNYHCSYKDKNTVIEDIIKSKTRRFILLRRLREEIKTSEIVQYFQDIDVIKLTNGEYNYIDVYRSKVYLSKYDFETNKMTHGEMIGYIKALSSEQHYAGGSYLDVTDIIFEEIISRSVYLGKSEPAKLMNFFCTVDRKRGTTRLWLCGNTISRVCPYFEEWGIDKLIRDMKQGEIKTTWIPTGEIDDKGVPIEVLLAVEYCKSTGASSFVIGKHKEMLNTGAWQTDPQPHLPKSYSEYKVLFRIGFLYKSFKFIGEYLLDKESKDVVWFIYPYNRDFNNKTLIFSDIIKTSKYWQRDIYNPSIKNKSIINLLQTFKECNIFYASDLCGTDFKQVIDFGIRK